MGATVPKHLKRRLTERKKSGQKKTPHAQGHGSLPHLTTSFTSSRTAGCITSRSPVSTQGALQRGRSCPTDRRWEARTFLYVERDVSGPSATLLVHQKSRVRNRGKDNGASGQQSNSTHHVAASHQESPATGHSSLATAAHVRLKTAPFSVKISRAG